MSTGTAVYGMLAGVCVAIGVLFSGLAIRRRQIPSIELFVGVLGLVGAGGVLSTLQLHSSDNAAEYAATLKGAFSLWGIAGWVAILWVVGFRANIGFPRIPLAFTGGAIIVLAINASSPGGLIVDEITGLRDVYLFGEAFVVHEPNRSSLQWVLLSYALASTSYVVVAMTLRRERLMWGSDPLFLGLIVALAAVLYDFLVDEGWVQTPYMAPFGVVAVALGLAVEHAQELTKSERRLAQQSAVLENLVVSRTQTLRATHDDLVGQLRLQNKNALELAQLSEMFVSLSSVSVTDDDIDKALTDVVGRLAVIVQAGQAHLTWASPSAPGGGNVVDVQWAVPRLAAETPGGEQLHEITKVLTGGEDSTGSLTIRRHGSQPFSDQERRLVGLMAEYLGSFVQRLQLETRLVNSAVDHERERIARDLHDSLSQTLYAAAFNAEALSLTVTTDSDLAAESAVKIRIMVLSALAEIRTLLFELQPTETSLAELIKTLCMSLEEIYGMRIQLSIVGDGPPVPPRPKLAMYRIGQEALNNAFRHSGAEGIHVTLGIDDHGARITVSDDGVGFDVDAISTGHGLRNIRERAGEVGASIDITSSTASGTALSATWLRVPAEPTLDLTRLPRMGQIA